MNKTILRKGIAILALLTAIVSFSGCLKKDAGSSDFADKTVQEKKKEGETTAGQEKGTDVLGNTENSKEKKPTVSVDKEEQQDQKQEAGEKEDEKENSLQNEEFKIELKEGEQGHFD